jgi:20S proteasome subunit alpha 2
MTDSQYSFSLTTFNPSGKLSQIEYALNAVNLGSTCLGICVSSGVVIAAENKMSSNLVDYPTVKKISEITPNIAVVYSGIGPDSRALVRRARQSAEAYYCIYREQIPIAQLVQQTATVMQEFTQSGGVRPFGVSLLMAGFDDYGPQLYQIDPSGSFFSWKASAIGSNMNNTNNLLTSRYASEIDLEDAIHMIIRTINDGHDNRLSEKTIELAFIGPNRRFQVLKGSELRDYLNVISA